MRVVKKGLLKESVIGNELFKSFYGEDLIEEMRKLFEKLNELLLNQS